MTWELCLETKQIPWSAYLFSLFFCLQMDSDIIPFFWRRRDYFLEELYFCLTVFLHFFMHLIQKTVFWKPKISAFHRSRWNVEKKGGVVKLDACVLEVAGTFDPPFEPILTRVLTTLKEMRGSLFFLFEDRAVSLRLCLRGLNRIHFIFYPKGALFRVYASHMDSWLF